MTISARARRTLAALVLPLALALAAAGLVPAGGVHAAAAAPVSVSPARPMAGERTVFSGRLPGSRRPVLLQRRTGQRWQVVDRGRSSAKGRYRLAAKVPRTGSYRVLAPRTAGRPPATSRVRKVRTVRQKARILTVDAPLVVGLARTVTAKVTPARKGRKVALQRRVGSGWTTVTKARSDKQGVARIAHAASTPGDAAHRVVALRFRGSRKSPPSTPLSLHTARTTTLVSPGTEAGQQSSTPSLSADGRWVAFTSGARLLPTDVDDYNDAYLFDRRLGTLSHLLAAANHHVNSALISGNGRFVALDVLASNLAGEPTYDSDVFVLDRSTGVVDLVSQTPGGQPASDRSFAYGISDDGRFVAFASFADDLLALLNPADTTVRHAYLHDRSTQTNRGLDRVGVGWADFNVYGMDLSGDGTAVAFQNGDPALDADIDGIAIFGWTINPSGSISDRTNLTPDVHAHSPRLSRTGDLLAFTSDEDLVALDTNGQSDAYVRYAAGSYQLVAPVGPGDTTADDISADGRYVAVNTENPMPGDTNGNDEDIVIRDRATGADRLVTRGGPGASSEATLSANGSVVAFGSETAGLAPGATGDWNVYVATLR